MDLCGQAEVSSVDRRLFADQMFLTAYGFEELEDKAKFLAPQSATCAISCVADWGVIRYGDYGVSFLIKAIHILIPDGFEHRSERFLSFR